jgi:DNA-directed RNA polymerase sigma subunit (sigma70/sigma32)
MEEKIKEISEHRWHIHRIRSEMRIGIDTSKKLDTKLKMLLRHRHCFGETLEEVGKKFGVTRERIRQLEAKGFEILRQEYNDLNKSS